jgi:uncharacterized protein (TIGR03083 family)
MLDCGGIYAEGRARLTEIARSLTVQEEAVVVPACPEWTVHDVFAHLVGVCADVRAGRTEGITTASWANRQARERRGRTMAELLEEWSVEAPPVEAAVVGAPDPMPILWVLDQTAHEQDIRGAIGRPGARDAPGLFAALDMLVVDGLGTQLRERGLGTLRVSTPERAWTVGERDGADHGVPVSVEVSSFELFRGLTGRRSAAQIARFRWSADPGPYLAAFQFGTFTTRNADLEE